MRIVTALPPEIHVYPDASINPSLADRDPIHRALLVCVGWLQRTRVRQPTSAIREK